MNNLKRNCMIAGIGESLLFLIYGGIATFFAIVLLSAPQDEPIKLSQVDFSENLSGLYVTGNISGIYASYGEISKNNTVVQYEYLTDAGNMAYMGIRMDADDKDKAEKLMETIYEYSYNGGSEEAVVNASFEVTGTIRKMEDEMIEIMHECVQWDLLTPEEQACFLPYYLEVEDEEKTNDIFAIIALLIGILLLGAGIYVIITAAQKGTKNIDNYINNSMNAEMAYQRVEQFLEGITPNDEFVYDTEFVYGRSGSTIAFAENDKIAWAYIHVLKQRVNFVPTSENYSVVIGLVDGSKQWLKFAMKEDAERALQIISQLSPKCIFGYTEQLNYLFTKDLQQFLALKYAL